MTPGRPRAGWKAWEPEEGTDPFYVGQGVSGLDAAKEPSKIIVVGENHYLQE